jgi:protein-disulfide isomerase
VADNSGGPTLVAALIIGVALIGSALVLRAPIERTADGIDGLNETLASLQAAAGAPSRAAARPSRPGRPDPSRRYSVKTEGSPQKGAEDAKLAIVEFSDFQCPFCGRVTPTLEQIEREYGDRVRIVFKHLPLAMHPKAPAAHAAAEAAHRQGRFWEMHDKIFADQANMSPEQYEKYAQELGLDMEQFERDVASAEVKARVDADVKEAASLGVTGTPAFFVNGRFLSGAQPFPAFKALIDEELGEAS